MPQYRLVPQPGHSHVVHLGIVDRPGRVVEWVGWPTAWMEPADEPARKIAAYAKQHGQMKPMSPRDERAGEFYLPAFGLREGDDVVLGMPVYETERAPFEWQGRTILAGTPLCWLSWPAWALHPVNEPAQRVREYFERHHRDPRLPRSPWNEYTNATWLPELRSRAAAARQPFAPSDVIGKTLAPDDFGIGRMAAGARR